MNFYKTKKIVLTQLKNMFESAKATKTEIDLNALRLNLMLNYEIGELSINKMIEMLSKHYEFKVTDDVVVWG